MTPWMMLQGQAKFTALAGPGTLCGVSLSGYVVVAPIWMPSQIATDQSQCGVFGIALALIT